jgi:hypothetical protein
LSECNSRCNKTSDEQCLPVNDTMNLRLAKRAGTIYLTQEFNVMQGGVGAYVEPFAGSERVNLDSPPSYVSEAGSDGWNVMYFYRNYVNDTVSLVFSLNITFPEKGIMNLTDLSGDVVNVTSKEGGTVPEFNLEANPTARWNGQATPSVHGGVVEFTKGFSVCIHPDPYNMPDSQWIVLSSDGSRVKLENYQEVCLAYP